MSIDNPFKIQKLDRAIYPIYDYSGILESLDPLEIGEGIAVILEKPHRGFGQSIFQLVSEKYGITRTYKCKTIKEAGVEKYLKWSIMRVNYQEPKKEDSADVSIS